MTKLPWVWIGVGLVAVGLAALAAHVLPLEMSVAVVLFGSAWIVFGLQQKGAMLPKIPSVLVWLIVALGLAAFFYFLNGHDR